MLVKILGGIDLVAALVFFIAIFGSEPPISLILFAAALLAVKGLFVFLGDVLSYVDLASAVILVAMAAFTLPTVILWIPALLLLAKGTVSMF